MMELTMTENIESRPQSPDAQPQRFRSMSGSMRIALLIIASIASIWALQWGRSFLIPLAVAIFLAFWLMPVVNWLQRLRVPRALGAAVVLTSLIVAVGGGAYSLRDEARALVNSLSDATHKVRVAYDRAERDPSGWLHDLRTILTAPAPANAKSPQVNSSTSVDLQSALVRSSATAVSAAIDIAVVLFLMYFLLASGDLFKRKLFTVITRQNGRPRITAEILDEIGTQFQRYLGVLAGSNVALGFLTWGLFALLDVRHAAVWGVTAGLLHMIPYLGPAIFALASFVVCSTDFNSLTDAAVVALGSLGISAVIGMVLTTALASRASHMNSVAAFAGLMFWGWLWGVPGLLLGTPLMMAMNVVAERIEGLSWLSTFLVGRPRRERRQRE